MITNDIQMFTRMPISTVAGSMRRDSTQSRPRP